MRKKPEANKDARYVRTVAERLNDALGAPEEVGFLESVAKDPVATLIKTVLSQATNDTNSGKAFDNLQKAYPAWDDVALANEGDIAQLIKIGGLGPQKARRIKQILGAIKDRAGDYDLSFLSTMADDEAWRFLMSLDGVGPKTAACTLLFSFGRPVFPVDTHIHRIAQRLGIVSPGISAEHTQQVLQELVPPGLTGPTHVNLIRLGREICDARNPKCYACPLCDLCETHSQDAR